MFSLYFSRHEVTEPRPYSCSMFISPLSPDGRTAALQSPCDWLWPLTTDTPHSLLSSASVSPVSVSWALAAWRRGEELRWHSDPVLAPASDWSPGHNAALWLVRAHLIPGQRPARDRFSGSWAPELLCFMWVMGGGWGNGLVCLNWESCFMLDNAK